MTKIMIRIFIIKYIGWMFLPKNKIKYRSDQDIRLKSRIKIDPQTFTRKILNHTSRLLQLEIEFLVQSN